MISLNPSRSKRLIALLVMLMSLALGSAQAQSADAERPVITSFTSSATTVDRAALQNRSARIPVAWTTANRPLFANLVFEQIVDRVAVNVELPRTNPWVNSNEKGMVAPYLPSEGNFVVLRVRLVHFFLPIIYDERELRLPISTADAKTPTITQFSTSLSRVDSAALNQGNLRIPVSWNVINRPQNATLVFEQVFDDGRWQNVELPRANPWVNSSGDGVVAPIYGAGVSREVVLRLRLIDTRSGEVYDQADIRLPLDVAAPPVVLTPTHTPAPASASFDVQPRQVREGDTVTISWNVPNQPQVDLMFSAPSMRSGWQKINQTPLGSSGTFNFTIPNGARRLTFFAPNVSDASNPSNITVTVDCRAAWAVDIGQSAEQVCPLGGDGTNGQPLPITATYQTFANGQMWYYNQQIVVLYNDGTGQRFSDDWSGAALPDLGLIAPTGQFLPANAFGHLWTREASVRDRLGFATAPEQQVASAIQSAALTSTSELWLIRMPDASHRLIQHNAGGSQWWPK